jgi:anti-sigma factor RsiW
MKTNCESTALQVGEQELNAFVDGVLDDDRRVDLYAHLASHPADAERVNAYFRQKVALEELRDVLAEDDDDEFLPELQRRIDSAVTRQRLFVIGRGLAAGLAMLAPLAAIGWWTLSRPSEPVVATVSEPLPADVGPAFPFGGTFAPIGARAIDEGAASLGRLARYLDSRSLSVPDLGTLGLRLVGGEAIPGVELPAARLIYVDERGNRLLVYVAVVEGEGQQAITVVPEGHLSLHWRNGPLVFAVVGPAGAATLIDVMRSVSNDLTEMADAPASDPLPVADSSLHGSVEVQPVMLPDSPAADKQPPQMLPADKSSEPTLTPIGLETSQPKV